MFDASQIEPIKENLKPLRQGRSTQELQGIVQQQQGLGANNDYKTQERNKWEYRLLNEMPTKDDPLGFFLQYIAWLDVNFPAQGNASQMMQVLERCGKAFVPLKMYHNDVRYVEHVWLRYIDLCKEPLDVFLFLNQQGIGQQNLQLLKRWSQVYEMKQDHKTAFDFLEKAIQHLRSSKKLDDAKQLQNHFENYQHRFMNESMKQMEEAAKEEPEEPSRQAFTTLPTTSTSTVRPLAAKPVNQMQPMKMVKMPATQAKPASNAKITIFDDSKKKTIAPSNPVPSFKQPSATTTTTTTSSRFMTLASESEKNKENTMQATTWTQHTVKQQAAPAVKKHSFTMFEDNAEEDTPCHVHQQQHAQQHRVLQPSTNYNSS